MEASQLVVKIQTEQRDTYLDLARLWGLTVAYSITQNAQVAEQIVADAMAAVLTLDILAVGNASFSPSQLQRSYCAVRFAGKIWELSREHMFRGFTHDSFFRLPPMTRAAVVLKTRARLSRAQLAQAFSIEAEVIDSLLESARLLFTEGRSWLAPANSGARRPSSNTVSEPSCPLWATDARSAEHLPLQELFSRYLGNDLSAVDATDLSQHLFKCAPCRHAFESFKRCYQAWSSSIPEMVLDPSAERYFDQVASSTIALNRRGRSPSPWPGVRKILLDRQIQFLILAAIIVMGLQFYQAIQQRGYQPTAGRESSSPSSK